MIKSIFLMNSAMILFLCFLTSCGLHVTTFENDITQGSSNTPSTETTVPETSETKVKVNIPQYFWGTWQRMDNGEIFEIDEKLIYRGKRQYLVSSQDENSITISILGTFERQSDRVMVNNNIPYFRKGGANLEYKMRLVGFEDEISRAASSVNLSGLKVKGKSDKYESFSCETESEEDGSITLKTPVSGDIQTVTVTNGDSTIAVVPGITVENNGSNMGTIPISSEGQYCLKVTGTIPEEEKEDGYLYGNNYKTYTMTLTITNISDVASEPSAISISSENNLIHVESADRTNLNLITVSTLKAGMKKQINLLITCDILKEPYLDSGINVTITNLSTRKSWIDFIPLRFFKGLAPLTIAAESTEGNADASLNGFIINPDGKAQFFSIPDKGDKTLFVPTFGTENKYLLAFSGATVEGTLSNSTEMFYTVNPNTTDLLEIKIPDNINDLLDCYNHGEPNDLEANAFTASQRFTAYLKDGDIDYYKISANTNDLILPGGTRFYRIRYENDRGTKPDTISIKEGEPISKANLPTLPGYDYYYFDGWYIGGYKIDENYQVNSNITLTAKYKPIEYSVSYELNGGMNSAENTTTYTIESETFALSEPERKGYIFKGWYDNADFNRDAITQIEQGHTGNIALYAKWDIITYTITYELNEGENDSRNETSFTVESQTIILYEPKKENSFFKGWFRDPDFTGEAVTEITQGSTGNVKLYAKWGPAYLTITSNEINSLDLSKYSGTITIDLTGETSLTALNKLVTKLKATTLKTELDLSKTTGLTTLVDSKVNNNQSTVFRGCENLTSVTLPNSLTVLGIAAFQNCTSLEYINIPSGVISLKDNTFEQCESLKYIEIPETIQEIGFSCFLGCEKLETITIHNGVKYIYTGAFMNCISLKTITIPDSVIMLFGGRVFENCTSLESATLGKGITEFAHSNFYGCINLKRIIIEGDVTCIAGLGPLVVNFETGKDMIQTYDQQLYSLTSVEFKHLSNYNFKIQTNRDTRYYTTVNLKDPQLTAEYFRETWPGIAMYRIDRY